MEKAVKIPTYEELLKLGIEEREKGSVKQSIKCFEKTLLFAERDNKKIVEVLSHLGLSYYHNGNQEKAKKTWQKAYKIAVKAKDYNGQAVALRNLSRKQLYLNGSGLVQALSCAEEAVSIAENLGRKDLPWFLHGLFSATEVLGEKDKLKFILRREIKALIKVWNKTPKLERNVWLDGLLMDYVSIHDKIGKPLLYLARYLARLQGLKRREEQINNLLSLV
ncbi:tetratricopeptide repeat protein [candidate division WWE3 bacterium]|uniref:Tetratricopeptide repeat protein n=1 Tax=candidate division WWE3 bacterium TaxID=2053526 RepID=A0A7X9E7M5_UNCKA|nr:tetratricopeptide repeat protein [candidate division WWE3 bacterium]